MAKRAGGKGEPKGRPAAAPGSQKLAPSALLASLSKGGAQVTLNAALSSEYGTVEASEWLAQPPAGTVYVSNLCETEEAVRKLRFYHTDGVPRNRARVHEVDHLPDSPSADGPATLDLYLVHVVSIT